MNVLSLIRFLVNEVTCSKSLACLRKNSLQLTHGRSHSWNLTSLHLRKSSVEELALPLSQKSLLEELTRIARWKSLLRFTLP